MPLVPQPPRPPQALLWSMAGVKLVVILFIGFLIGAVGATAIATEVEDVKDMTQEEYAAGFEDYRNETLAMQSPWITDVLMVMFLIAGLLIFYEVITWALGWGIAQLFKPRSQQYVPPGDSSPFESY